ncbi:MAG: hypothetical protein ACX936_21230, partial [Marinobacter sp.]
NNNNNRVNNKKNGGKKGRGNSNGQQNGGSPKNRGQGTPSKNNRFAWLSVPPKPGDPDVKVFGDKAYKWCAKCDRGKGRWSPSHETSTHNSHQHPLPSPGANLAFPNLTTNLAFNGDDSENPANTHGAWNVSIASYVPYLIALDAWIAQHLVAVLFGLFAAVTLWMPLAQIFAALQTTGLIVVTWSIANAAIPGTFMLWAFVVALTLTLIQRVPPRSWSQPYATSLLDAISPPTIPLDLPPTQQSSRIRAPCIFDPYQMATSHAYLD